jgi:hypothetical protein
VLVGTLLILGTAKWSTSLALIVLELGWGSGAKSLVQY